MQWQATRKNTKFN